MALGRLFALLLVMDGLASPSISFAQNFTSLQDFGIEQKRVMDEYPAVKLRALDKITARTQTFTARIGETVQFDSLFINVKTCQKAPPIEEPESAAFLQIWQMNPKSEESEWVFSGWMFASSPALSPMDHAVYDVWVLDCAGERPPEKALIETDASVDIPSESAPDSPPAE